MHGIPGKSKIIRRMLLLSTLLEMKNSYYFRALLAVTIISYGHFLCSESDMISYNSLFVLLSLDRYTRIGKCGPYRCGFMKGKYAVSASY